MRRWPKSRLGRVLARLEQHYGPAAHVFPDTAFGMLLWEIVGYMASDPVRARAMRMLEERVGLEPAAIVSAPLELLEEVTRSGGAIAFRERAERLRVAARMVLADYAGGVEEVFALPENKAITKLAKFPMTGKPGAAKILLFSGGRAVTALDSNGMRVVGRIARHAEGDAYAAAYKKACAVMAAELPSDAPLLQDAFVLLRRYGMEICKHKSPRCESCPVREQCAFPSR